MLNLLLQSFSKECQSPTHPVFTKNTLFQRGGGCPRSELREGFVTQLFRPTMQKNNVMMA